MDVGSAVSDLDDVADAIKETVAVGEPEGAGGMADTDADTDLEAETDDDVDADVDGVFDTDNVMLRLTVDDTDAVLDAVLDGDDDGDDDSVTVVDVDAEKVAVALAVIDDAAPHRGRQYKPGRGHNTVLFIT